MFAKSPVCSGGVREMLMGMMSMLQQYHSVQDRPILFKILTHH